MPIYEYMCGECGNTFEKLVRRSEEKISCPKCASENVNKEFSVFGFKSSSKFVSSSGSSGCSSCNASSCKGCSSGI